MSIEQPGNPANGKPSEQPANSSHTQKAENDGAAIFSIAARNGPQPDKRAGTSGEVFNHAPPEGHAKTVSAVLGEIVWLMSQSPLHRKFFIEDLEWFVMTPVLQQQFRLYYAQNKPIGVVLWAFADDEVAKRLAEGTIKLRPQDWKSGDQLWVVEVIAPFGGAEEMVTDLKGRVFPETTLRYATLSGAGAKTVKAV